LSSSIQKLPQSVSVTSCFQTNSIGHTEEYIHQSGSFKRLMNQVLGESEY